MADYAPIGSRFKTAAADTTGQNRGNYTASFGQADWVVNWPAFECARIVVTNVPVLTQFTLALNGKTWDTANGGFNSLTTWDAINPMLLGPGDQLDFLFSLATSTTPAPVVTLWLRVDVALPANKRIAGTVL
jgi:hypothetical protein